MAADRAQASGLQTDPVFWGAQSGLVYDCHPKYLTIWPEGLPTRGEPSVPNHLPSVPLRACPHLQGTYSAYILALVIASAAWDLPLVPLHPSSPLHLQGTYSAYILAFVVASAAWDLHMAPNPLDPLAGRRLRRLLFEVGAGDGQPPELLAQLLLLPPTTPTVVVPDDNQAAEVTELRAEEGEEASQQGRAGKETAAAREPMLSIHDEYFEDGTQGLCVELLQPEKLKGWLWTGHRHVV